MKDTRPVCNPPTPAPGPPCVGAHVAAPVLPGPAGERPGAAVQQPCQRAPAALLQPDAAGPGGGKRRCAWRWPGAPRPSRAGAIPEKQRALSQELGPTLSALLGLILLTWTMAGALPALAPVSAPANVVVLCNWPRAGCSQEACRRERLPWVPVPQPVQDTCLDLLVDQPHSLLSILDAQTWLSQVSPEWWGPWWPGQGQQAL